MVSKYGLRNMNRWMARRTGPSPFSSSRNRTLARATLQRFARRSLYTMRRRKKNVKSGLGITTQHDQRRVYTKRSMPLAKKKSWKAFVRKVNAVSEKELGARQVVFNKLVQFSNDVATQQSYGAVYLYGQKSTSSYASDLSQIGALENTGDPTAAAGVTVDASTKYLFQSGVLDITVRNASDIKNNDLSYSLDSKNKMEIDVYELTMRREAEDSTTNFQTIEEIFEENWKKCKTINGAATEVTQYLRGCTPFDLSYSLSRFGVRILKKTKYMVPNGETFTYQVRDPKRYSFNRKDIENNEGFNRPGITRIVYFIGKLVPGVTVGSAIGNSREIMQIGVSRKYLYKIEGVNEDRTAWLNA